MAEVASDSTDGRARENMCAYFQCEDDHTSVTSADGPQFIFTDTIFVGHVTDVRVLYRVDVNGTIMKRLIRITSALDDAAAQIEADGVDCSSEARSMASDLLSYSKYCKRYRLRRALAVHVASCRGPDPDRSVLAGGASLEMDLLYTQQLCVYTL